jgi:thymidine phosphorylase/intein/homing endonuclease
MNLKAKFLGLESGGKPIVILNVEDAGDLGIHSLDRVRISYKKNYVTAIVNVTEKIVEKGTIGLYEEVRTVLGLEKEEVIEVEVAKFPQSLHFIRNKLKGRKLNYEEIKQIVKDVVERNLSDIEISAFVTTLHNTGLDLDEATSLSLAMVETGKKLKLNKKIVCDKHSVSYGTPILVREDGNIKIVKIGELVDGIIRNSGNVLNFPDGSQYCRVEGGYEVPAFDEELNVEFRRVTGVYRHPSPKKMIRITLVGNRQVDVTEAHSVFRLNDGRLESIPTREIKVGDFLAVPRKVIENDKIKEINLIMELLKLPSKEVSHIYITGLKDPEVRKYLTKSQKINGLVPINLLRKVKCNLPKRGLKLKIRYGKPINALIKVNKDFVKLLGYYIAEGFINENGISIDFGSHERELIEDVKKCVKRVFGINATETFPHRTAVHVCIYNKLLALIFEKVFKVGKRSNEKEIPALIFNTSPQLQLEFLRSYFLGDGYFRRGYEATAVTVSKKLIIGITYLLSNLGISFTVSSRLPGYRKFPHNLSKTRRSFLIYTQANKLLERQSTTAAYLNFLPIRESNLALLAHNPLIKGWENRRILKRQGYITFEKVQQLLQNLDVEKANEKEIELLKELRKIAKGEIGFLPVKKLEKINSTSKYVYDLCVEKYENFIGGNGPIFLHNSAGGVPGDKTTLFLVPIIASLGLTIPKTSSRAITSPAGTADRAGCLMPVNLTIEEMKKVVEKTNGCIVWGGTLQLAPADDIFIQVEYPLGIDPLLLPSIMAKKKAVGATHLVIDIPTGRGAKIKTIGDADLLAKDFIELGKRVGIKVQCAVTYGEQPVGYSIGPALEAREALEVISRRRVVSDLEEKVCSLAQILLAMVGRRNSENLAKAALNSGKAMKKLYEIMEAQGGKKISPEEVEVGEYKLDINSEKNGRVLWIDNGGISELAKAAGAPKDKGAGVILHKKLGDPVKKEEKILTIYAEKLRKLERASNLLKEEAPVGVGEKREMLIHRVREIPVTKKMFVLER